MSSSSSVFDLDALPGLRAAKLAVRKLATRESGVHAVLLYGVEGSGKDDLASFLAAAWLCRQVGENGPCGVCQACGAFQRHANADFQLIEPIGASNLIRVQAIFETDEPEPPPPTPTVPLQTFFRTQPLMSRNKVAIISQAERMNARAANALLKTLEEPYSYAKLILVTSSIGALLPTILSRCLALHCELPDADVVDASPMELALSDGAPGLVRVVREHSEVFGALYSFAESLPDRSFGEVLVCSEAFQEIAEGLEKALDLNARGANAEALKYLGNAVRGRRPDWGGAIADAHRRIVGNAQPGPVFDALFASLLQRA